MQGGADLPKGAANAMTHADKAVGFIQEVIEIFSITILDERAQDSS